MSSNQGIFRLRICWLLAVIATAIACPAAKAAVTVLGVQYQQDNPFNEFICLWYDPYYPTNCPGEAIQGANLHVYLKNTGAASVAITDVTLGSYNLNTILKLNTGVHDARSIYFYWDNPPQDVFDLGEPVWFKGDPSTIPAGAVAQAVVRLRSVPVTPTVNVGVVTSAGTVNTNITIDANAPQLASIGYSADRTKVYLHWRRNGGAAPTSVWMDGVNVTANTTTVGDPSVHFAASVITLAAPFTLMSYHVYQGVYADGKVASASQRAWVNKFIHGTYGTFELDASYTVADWIAEASDHGINNCQVMVGDVGGYMFTAAGRADCLAREFGYTTGDKTKFNPVDPDMFFIDDETDAEDQNMERSFCGTGLRLECGRSSMGILAMRTIAQGEELRVLKPLTPTSVNMDGSHRPENFYSYGQAVDILQADPYYQARVRDSQWFFSNTIPLYRKASYIYASARAVTTAAEPNPSNLLLYSCEWKCTDAERCGPHLNEVWPFPTPESKRIEAYYALAGGVKGLGYWWLPKGYPSNGLADQGKATARALWKEMGLYGNEIKTASPLLVTSHPVDLVVQGSSNVWVRALACRTDTIILIVVNDDYYNDQAGCHYSQVPNATVMATLPTWMQSPTAFEISAGGLSDVSTQPNGNQLQVNLGTLKLTRMIVLTKDPQLRSTIQQRYDQMVRPGICNFAPELCINYPPSIAQSPANQSVVPGGTANFTVVAGGTSPLRYQWQKNNANLSNAGHYSGCTNLTLTISNADANDAANYRCIVTNAYGSTNSSAASLTVTNFISPPVITRQPANQNVILGATASFTVSASGSNPLSYQWQKANANLNNGGHYSGCTTTNLTITGADANDAANYRCVVTNAYGSTNSAGATLVVDLNLCTPGVLLRHGDMEDVNVYSVCPDWQSYSAGNGVASWAEELTIIHGGLAAQKVRNINGGTGSLLGVRQTFDANVGDAFTFSGWVYPASQPAYQQVAMVAMWDGATANPATGSGTWNISTGVRLVWTQLQNLAGNATATNVTLFLDSRRISGSIDVTAYWDDVVSYRAYVPPAPALSVAGSTSLNVDLLPGCNTNNAAQFAISIGGGAYTLGTHWVQANGTVNTTSYWQSDAAWANKTVTGLATGTPYTFKVQARYSSANPQPTSLGAGATLAPSTTQQRPQLLAQRNGNNLTLAWPEVPSAHLERAANLTPPVSWTTVTNQASVGGGQKSVTITPMGNAGYFRLVLE